MFGIEVWSSFLYLSHQCCYADSFFLSIRFLRSCNKLRSRCCRTHLRLELFHSVTLFLCTCFLELELLIFFLSLWCSLNLICLPAPPVTSCDLFSIDNKICFVKKNPVLLIISWLVDFVSIDLMQVSQPVVSYQGPRT